MRSGGFCPLFGGVRLHLKAGATGGAVLEPRWGSWVSRFDGSQMKPTRCDWKIASDVFNQCMKLPGAKSYGNIIDLIGSALPRRLVNTKNTLSSFYLVLKFQNKCTLTNYSE